MGDMPLLEVLLRIRLAAFGLRAQLDAIGDIILRAAGQRHHPLTRRRGFAFDLFGIRPGLHGVLPHCQIAKTYGSLLPCRRS